MENATSLLAVIADILDTGELSVSQERQLQSSLARDDLGPAELAAADRLLEALCNGAIQPVITKTNAPSRATDR